MGYLLLFMLRILVSRIDLLLSYLLALFGFVGLTGGIFWGVLFLIILLVLT